MPKVRCETKGCHSHNATVCYRLDTNLRETRRRLCNPCRINQNYTRVDHSRGPWGGSGKAPAE